MFKCMCGREVKSSSGLKRHQSNCSEYQESLDVPEIKEIVEQKSVPKVGTEIAEELQRRIAKLEMSIKQCYDAETKYRLECELKELKGRL